MKFQKKIPYAIVIFIILYFLWIFAFPFLFFSKSLELKNEKIYYNGNKDHQKELELILNKCNLLLGNSELPPPQKSTIVLCSSSLQFACFALMQYDAFAINRRGVNIIILSKCNISDDEVIANRPDNNISEMSKTIAHEIVHTEIRNHFGSLKSFTIPSWKEEGYCDYVAKRSSFEFEKGLTYFCSASSEPQSLAYSYFLYRLYIMYLLEYKKKTFETVVKEDYDLNELNREIREKIKNNLFKPG